MSGIFGFLGRQIKTKTGQAGMGLIVGAVANHLVGPNVAAAAPEIVNTAINGTFNAGNAVLGLLAMFLRDKAAKEQFPR
jgi:hypothetical protein